LHSHNTAIFVFVAIVLDTDTDTVPITTCQFHLLWETETKTIKVEGIQGNQQTAGKSQRHKKRHLNASCDT
jgi:hypothetical protein